MYSIFVVEVNSLLEGNAMTTAASKFKKGSGCFKCTLCGKMTRDVNGDNGFAEQCVVCYESGGCGNSLSDEGYAEMTKEEGDEKCPWAIFDDCKTRKEVHELFDREYARLMAWRKAKHEAEQEQPKEYSVQKADGEAWINYGGEFVARVKKQLNSTRRWNAQIKIAIMIHQDLGYTGGTDEFATQFTHLLQAWDAAEKVNSVKIPR